METFSLPGISWCMTFIYLFRHQHLNGEWQLLRPMPFGEQFRVKAKKKRREISAQIRAKPASLNSHHMFIVKTKLYQYGIQMNRTHVPDGCAK